MCNNILEYELIGIEFHPTYILPEEESSLVREDGPFVEKNHEIQYDADGIPMGQTMPEIRERERIIKDFLKKWGDENPERRVFNSKLEDYIHIKGISVIEAKEHSAKSYLSTRAVLKIEEVMKDALPVGRVQIKKDDSNQSIFLYLIVMVYRSKELGTTKLTVGVRKSNNEKIEYGVSVLKTDEPLIKKLPSKEKKKRRPHK